jgi:hypothetical protein
MNDSSSFNMHLASSGSVRPLIDSRAVQSRPIHWPIASLVLGVIIIRADSLSL